ncbi:MAG: TlpA disulfide reductase family protein [Pseudomonadota bacterium]
MSKGAIALILGVAVLFGVAGFGVGHLLQQRAAEERLAAAGATSTAEPGQPMPTFTLPDRNGNPVDASAFADQALLVNFWATWCTPCLEEMPALMAVHEAVAPRGGAVLGIALDRAEDVGPFLDELGVTYPIVIADGIEGNRLAQRFGNRNVLLPYSMLVAADGTIVETHFGELTEAEAMDLLEPLLPRE